MSGFSKWLNQMIKIEFKEAQRTLHAEFIFEFSNSGFVAGFFRKFFEGLEEFNRITSYIPTQDPYLDRSFVLQQLGISKEQDEEMQQKYK